MRARARASVCVRACVCVCVALNRSDARRLVAKPRASPAFADASELTLDAAIAANGKPSAFTATPRHVLLTGATGARTERRPAPTARTGR